MAKTPKPVATRENGGLVDQRGIPHTFEFTPGPDGGSEYKLRGIPTWFWRRVRAKARRDKRSVRSVVLSLLQDWIDEQQPVPPVHR